MELPMERHTAARWYTNSYVMEEYLAFIFMFDAGLNYYF